MKTIIFLFLVVFSTASHPKDYIKAGILVNGVLQNHGLVNGNTSIPLTLELDIKNIVKIGVRDLNKLCKNSRDLLFYLRLADGNNVKKLTTNLINPCYKSKHKKGLNLLITVIADNKKYTKKISLSVLADSYTPQ